MNTTPQYIPKSTPPKFVGIFTHPDILASYLKGIGLPLYREVGPAGSLFVTVFQNGT
jgi:hypothetical protein